MHADIRDVPCDSCQKQSTLTPHMCESQYCPCNALHIYEENEMVAFGPGSQYTGDTGIKMDDRGSWPEEDKPMKAAVSFNLEAASEEMNSLLDQLGERIAFLEDRLRHVIIEEENVAVTDPSPPVPADNRLHYEMLSFAARIRQYSYRLGQLTERVRL